MYLKPEQLPERVMSKIYMKIVATSLKTTSNKFNNPIKKHYNTVFKWQSFFKETFFCKYHLRKDATFSKYFIKANF